MATKLNNFTAVGCYPLMYLTKTGDALCAECASEDGTSATPEVNWEDRDLFCDACGARIESAYAEPET